MPEPEQGPINLAALGIDDIEHRLDSLRPVMETIGAVLIAAAQKAFEDKQFGTFKWPPQYEHGKDPWVHIAGVASDLSKGIGVKSSRYAPSEATLKDSGDLWRSIDFRAVTRDSVAVGSSVPYAKYHQWGSSLVGPAVQVVTGSMRQGLAKAWREADGGKKAALGKMWHWFKKDSINTHIRQRPFLGITDQIEDDIRETVEMYVQDGKV